MAYRYKKISVRGRKIDEHRYLMEQHIGRYLTSDEVVRHHNGEPKDNRLENLYITSREQQMKDQIEEGDFKDMDENERKNKSSIACLKKFGKKVMISDKQGNQLMIVGSISLAAKVIGCSKGNAGFVLKGKRKTVNGFKLNEIKRL